MKIAILHYVCGHSAQDLKEWIEFNGMKADVFRMKDVDRTDFREYDYVFAYGMGTVVKYKNIINNWIPTNICINKIKTFNKLREIGVPTVDYVTSKDKIPKDWETIVARKSLTGRKAEDIEYYDQVDDIPDGYKLFTEYFPNKYEYRVVVFKDTVVGHYFKKDVGDEWEFKLQPNKGFEEMDKACIKAAKAIGIDYVGFDVVANTKREFRILEANSGPMLTDEAAKAIVEFFLNLT